MSIVGRANLVKMVCMPQMLYVLHNCPIWLTLRLFRTIDSVFSDFVWMGGGAQLDAIANVRLYFIASQLQHWHGWEVVNMKDPTQKIVASQFKKKNTLWSS